MPSSFDLSLSAGYIIVKQLLQQRLFMMYEEEEEDADDDDDEDEKCQESIILWRSCDCSLAALARFEW